MSKTHTNKVHFFTNKVHFFVNLDTLYSLRSFLLHKVFDKTSLVSLRQKRGVLRRRRRRQR